MNLFSAITVLLHQARKIMQDSCDKEEMAMISASNKFRLLHLLFRLRFVKICEAYYIQYVVPFITAPENIIALC